MKVILDGKPIDDIPQDMQELVEELLELGQPVTTDYNGRLLKVVP